MGEVIIILLLSGLAISNAIQIRELQRVVALRWELFVTHTHRDHAIPPTPPPMGEQREPRRN